jgi:hypothetical protein
VTRSNPFAGEAIADTKVFCQQFPEAAEALGELIRKWTNAAGYTPICQTIAGFHNGEFGAINWGRYSQDSRNGSVTIIKAED